MKHSRLRALMNLSWWGVALIALLLPLGACHHDVRVEDDLDFELFDYELHTPYVMGADVGIRVSRREDASVDGWSVDARDPSVFAVDSATYNRDRENLYLECRAVAPGLTDLIVYDQDGHKETKRTIRVERPDRIDLVPAGLIKVRGDDAPGLEPTDPIRVLVGGTATFEVRYHLGSERLFGNNAVSVSVDDFLLDAYSDQTYLFENREWLRLSPDATGLYEVTLAVGGQDVQSYLVEAVAADVIEQVEIEAETTARAQKDDLLYLLAHARDESGEDIWGVAFDWAVDGAGEPGDGDLFYYYYEEGAAHQVSAHRNGASDEVTVFMSEGGVTSSNHLGCRTVDPGAGLVGLLLPLLFVALRLRRR